MAAKAKLQPLFDQMMATTNAVGKMKKRLHGIGRKHENLLAKFKKLNEELGELDLDLAGVLGEMKEIQPKLTYADPDLVHSFTALSLRAAHMSTASDAKTEKKLKLVPVIDQFADKHKVLLAKHDRVVAQLQAVSAEWREKAVEAANRGDSSALDQEGVAIEAFSKALRRGDDGE